jgi:BlaI family penicillinase repressor
MKFSDAEWQIMNALWKSHPATAREIMENLPKDITWAYATVKTMLSRLVTKKAVDEHKRGNTNFYKPLISQEKARQSALRTLVDKVLGGTVEPILYFLINEQKLSEKERRKMIQMLEEMDYSRKGKEHNSTE